MAAALAGASLIYGAGMLESGITFDFGQLVMDNELIALIKQFVRGIAVDDETLAIDEIHAVGAKGDFLSRNHTRHHIRDTMYPKLLDRQVRSRWEAAGGTDIAERSLAEARRLATEYEPQPLEDDVAKHMRDVVRAAEAAVGATTDVL